MQKISNSRHLMRVKRQLKRFRTFFVHAALTNVFLIVFIKRFLKIIILIFLNIYQHFAYLLWYRDIFKFGAVVVVFVYSFPDYAVLFCFYTNVYGK